MSITLEKRIDRPLLNAKAALILLIGLFGPTTPFVSEARSEGFGVEDILKSDNLIEFFANTARDVYYAEDNFAD